VTDPEEQQLAADADDAEVVDALPVPEGAPSREVPAPAAGGLRGSRGLVVAGPGLPIACELVRSRRKDRKALGEVRASRSFLVDIHLLNRN
jgi:hypothetical protein